jgi:hypothetical protein
VLIRPPLPEKKVWPETISTMRESVSKAAPGLYCHCEPGWNSSGPEPISR